MGALFAASPASIHPRPDGVDAAARPAARRTAAADRLQEIPGMVPPLTNLPHGMRLCAALPARRRALPRRVSALRGESGRAIGPRAGIPDRPTGAAMTDASPTCTAADRPPPSRCWWSTR